MTAGDRHGLRVVVGTGEGGSDPQVDVRPEDRSRCHEPARPGFAQSVTGGPQELEFRVRGLPVPQGNARAFVAGGRAIVVTGATKGVGGKSSPLAAWRHAIATEARAAIGEAPALDGPLTVIARFFFPRPVAHYLPANARRRSPELRLDAPRFVTRKPDVDKLARALLDALTGVAFRDDSQVAGLMAWKLYEDPDAGDHAGVAIRVSRLGETR